MLPFKWSHIGFIVVSSTVRYFSDLLKRERKEERKKDRRKPEVVDHWAGTWSVTVSGLDELHLPAASWWTPRGNIQHCSETRPTLRCPAKLPHQTQSQKPVSQVQEISFSPFPDWISKIYSRIITHSGFEGGWVRPVPQSGTGDPWQTACCSPDGQTGHR